jgi:hypothetical protein
MTEYGAELLRRQLNGKSLKTQNRLVVSKLRFGIPED